MQDVVEDVNCTIEGCQKGAENYKGLSNWSRHQEKKGAWTEIGGKELWVSIYEFLEKGCRIMRLIGKKGRSVRVIDGS